MQTWNKSFKALDLFNKGSYTSFAKAIKIRFDLLQIGHPRGALPLAEYYFAVQANGRQKAWH